jgi:serine-type D-Ala-D-Ala carboxypeptidase (penicillin-binding protein 5/6)
MKKLIVLCLSICLGMGLLPQQIHAQDDKAKQEPAQSSQDLAPSAKAAYLVENTTGKVIYAKHETDKLYPASMTKMMGLLLIFEALHDKKISWDESVSASEYAASMGGSQVFLEPGESMSVRDMVKSICIASANDAMVAMAEKVGGSNDHFVAMMNDKAKELKLSNSHFMNATGLHDPEHYTCAKDMSIIARALIAEGGDELLRITSTYDAYIRENTDKKFWLVNTNKLLKQYEGVDGLKTGFTTEAMSCITVTAKKKDLRLVAVAMGEPSSKQRNAEIKQMLDYGFSQYAQGLLYLKGTRLQAYTMENGKPSSVNLVTLKNLVYVFEKGSEPKETKKEITITKDTPPYKAKEAIGTVKITMSDGYTMEAPIGVDQDVEQLNYLDIFMKAFSDTLA